MTRLTSAIYTLALTLTDLSGHLAHAGNPVLTIGFDVGSPPFFDLKNGCPSGIYPLIVGAIFQDAGQPIIGYPAPFRRVLAYLDQGLWGAGGILKTPERQAKYDFSDAIYIEDNLLYFNKSKHQSMNSIADLEGKRVGVVLGWSYGEKIDALINNKFFSTEPVNTDLTNFKKLKLGRIDALLTIRDVGATITARGGYTDLATSGTPIFSNSSHIAFKKNPENGPLLKRLNASIKKLNESGKMQSLVKDYLQQVEATPSSKNTEDNYKKLTDRSGRTDCYLRGDPAD